MSLHGRRRASGFYEPVDSKDDNSVGNTKTCLFEVIPDYGRGRGGGGGVKGGGGVFSTTDVWETAACVKGLSSAVKDCGLYNEHKC